MACCVPFYGDHREWQEAADRDIAVLDVLGLDTDEEAVYRILLRHGPAPLETITELLGRPADAAVTSLTAKGLAHGPPYTPAPPAMGLGALLLDRQHALRAAQIEVGVLAETYRESPAGRRRHTEVVDLLETAEEIRQRFDQLQRAARHEVLAMVTAPALLVTAKENTAEGQALARGVRYRVLCERAMLEQPGGEEDLRDGLDSGEDVRFADTLPIKLLVADRSVALVPLLPRAGPDIVGALLVHPSGLLDALVALFESEWDRATSVRVDHGRVSDAPEATVSELDTRILSLLLAGLTDQATAVQLGLSIRTVQRRVRHLMDLAGVQTRLQLGWHAARQGWV
jgi:DNA-binding NarL/FixJ family response regulator